MTTASATADEHRILTDIGDQFKRRPLIQGLYCLDESLQESGNLGPSAFPFDAHRSRLSERQIQAQVETLTQNWAAMDQRTRIVGIGMDFFSEFSSSYAGGLTQTAMQALRVGPTGRLLMGLGTAAFKVAVEEKKKSIIEDLERNRDKIFQQQLANLYSEHDNLNDYFAGQEDAQAAIREKFGLDIVHDTNNHEFPSEAQVFVNEANIARALQAFEKGQLEQLREDMAQDQRLNDMQGSLEDFTARVAKGFEAVHDRLGNVEHEQAAMKTAYDELSETVQTVQDRLRDHGVQISANRDDIERAKGSIRQNRRDLDFLSVFLYEDAPPERKLALLKSSLLLPGIDKEVEQKKVAAALAYQKVVDTTKHALSESAGLITTLNNLGVGTGSAGKVVGAATAVFGGILSIYSGNVFAGLATITSLFGSKPDPATERHKQLVGMLRGISEQIGELGRHLDTRLNAIVENQKSLLENQKKILKQLTQLWRDVAFLGRSLHEDIFLNRELILAINRRALDQAESLLSPGLLKYGKPLPRHEVLYEHMRDEVGAGKNPWEVFTANLHQGDAAPPADWLVAKYHFEHYERGEMAGREEIAVEPGDETLFARRNDMRKRHDAYVGSYALLTKLASHLGIDVNQALAKAVMPVRHLDAARRKYLKNVEVDKEDLTNIWLLDGTVMGQYLHSGYVSRLAGLLLDVHRAWPTFHFDTKTDRMALYTMEEIKAETDLPLTPRKWFAEAIRLVNCVIAQEAIVSGEVLFGLLDIAAAKMVARMGWKKGATFDQKVIATSGVPNAAFWAEFCEELSRIAALDDVFASNLATVLVHARVSDVGLGHYFYRKAYDEAFESDMYEVLGIRPMSQPADQRPNWGIIREMRRGVGDVSQKEAIWILEMGKTEQPVRTLLPLPEEMADDDVGLQFHSVLPELIELRERLVHDQQYYVAPEELFAGLYPAGEETKAEALVDLLVENEVFLALGEKPSWEPV